MGMLKDYDDVSEVFTNWVKLEPSMRVVCVCAMVDWLSEQSGVSVEDELRTIGAIVGYVRKKEG